MTDPVHRGNGGAVRWLAGQRLALAVLAGGMVLTASVSGALAARVAEDRRSELDDLAARAGTAIERRVASYAEPLYGMSAVVGGPQPAGRSAFHRYLQLAGTARRQPGLLAYTFNRRVRGDETAGFEQAVRADTSLADDGFPDFRVFPVVPAGTDRVVVDFVEPMAGNEAVFGFDLNSDPVRRRAIDQARDSGHLVATKPLKLLQNGGTPGFLLYIPVYRTAGAPGTAPARRRHFAGVATAVVGLDQMLAGVLAGSPAERQRIHLLIRDVGATLDSPAGTAGVGALLFDSDGRGRRSSGPPVGSRSVDLNVGGRRWRLFAGPTTDFGSAQGAMLAWVTASAGCVLSVLLAALIVSLSGSKRRAVALANGMTTTLRRQEDDLRSANRHLAESNAALAAADQVKDVFLGTMSHELRTPLTAIAGFARLLETRWERLGPDERQESLRRIVGSAHTLGGLVDDLLEFNPTGDEAPALSLEALELGLVTRQVVDELGPLTTTHHLRLETAEVAVLGNRVAVARIVTNLVTNAVKFSPEGTTVTVVTRLDGGGAVLEVADQGPGVPPDERDRVFERFYRGVLPDHAQRPGTGIGLAVVRDLAERMGGSVRVVDAPAGGAVFRVALAVAAAPATGGRGAAAQPEPAR